MESGGKDGGQWGGSVWGGKWGGEEYLMSQKYEVSAYYFPNYHPDSRNAKVHHPGWTEWDVVKNAVPRYPGHVQPKEPLWGHEDESDPRVMAKKIQAARDHGVTHLIFDWYWYDDGPFLEGCLQNGFLKADNKDDIKFSLMWANHNWFDMHPARVGQPAKMLFPGKVAPKTFETVIDHVIENYFSDSAYFKIDNKCYFSIYELHTLIDGLGGVDVMAAMLDLFRERVEKQGLALHINAIDRGLDLSTPEGGDPNEMIRRLCIDSVTSYVWVHHVELNRFPTTPYDYVSQNAIEYWPSAAAKYACDYYPTVSIGWDPSPRIYHEDKFIDMGNPFRYIIDGNTPAAFGENLAKAKDYLDKQSNLKTKMLVINAWNEWTEGTYLEPDIEHGYGYLESINRVFG